MSDRQYRRLVRQAAVPPNTALRQNRVKYDRIHAPYDEVVIRMHIVLVCHRNDAVASFRIDEEVICQGGSQRCDTMPAQIGQRSIPLLVSGADSQHLAELVIG